MFQCVCVFVCTITLDGQLLHKQSDRSPPRYAGWINIPAAANQSLGLSHGGSEVGLGDWRKTKRRGSVGVFLRWGGGGAAGGVRGCLVTCHPTEEWTDLQWCFNGS